MGLNGTRTFIERRSRASGHRRLGAAAYRRLAVWNLNGESPSAGAPPLDYC